MRFTRFVIFALLAALLAAPMAKAQNSPRNFGSANCAQKFPCAGIDPSQLSEIANNCSVNAFGLSTQQTGIFDSASLDGNNCMTGQLQSSSISPQCCIVAEGDTCSLRCTLH